MSPPTIVAIETSQNMCAVALRAATGIVVREHSAARQHARLLLPMLKELLDDCKLSMSDIDAVAFGRGPGSFTGARIAASVSQGLAFGANCPLIPLSSLSILAHSLMSAAGTKHARVLVAIDARMNEVYLGGYNCGGQTAEAIVDDVLVSPKAAIAILQEQRHNDASLLFGGDAISMLIDLAKTNEAAELLGYLQAIGEAQTNVQVSAASALVLAETAWAAGLSCSPQDALPTYLRGAGAWKKLADQ